MEYNSSSPRRFPAVARAFLAFLACVGAWLSLVEHSVRDRGVGGSNPLAPTNFRKNIGEFDRLSPAVIGVIGGFLVQILSSPHAD